MHELGEVKKVIFGLVVTSDAVAGGVKRDEITPLVSQLLASEGHILRCSYIVPNDVGAIKDAVTKCIGECDVVLVTGGTGLSSKDLSVAVVSEMADYEVPGFGELFRYLSFLEIGARSWISRASAYVCSRKLVIVLPGNPRAVELGLKKLILPVIRHAVYELRR